jgi:hypothetical protein
MWLFNPKQRRLLIGFIVFIFIALLSCNLPTIQKAQPTQAEQKQAQPIQGSEQKSTAVNPSKRIEIQAGSPISLTSGTIGSTGGTIRIDQGGPINGFQIDVPPGAYAKDTIFSISYRDIKSTTLDSDIKVLSPLIHVDNGGTWSEAYITVTLPIKVNANQFAMLFTYDEASGELDGLPVLSEEGGQLKAVTQHFSEILGVEIDEAELDAWSGGTGFEQGVDNWQFANYGSYLAPDGHCAGQSLTAMLYYTLKKGDPLYGKYDNYNNPFHKTPTLMWDDRAGIRLAEVAQVTADWDNRLRNLWRTIQHTYKDEIIYYSFALALKASGEPQYVAIRNNTGGHAMIIYRKYQDRFYVSDPNYPEPDAHRAIVYDRASKKFKTYYSGSDAAHLGVPFPTIIYINKYGMLSPNQFNYLWSKLEDGSIGQGFFPDYSLVSLEQQADGTYAVKGKVTNNYKVPENKVRLQMNLAGPHRVIVYNDQAVEMNKYYNASFELDVKGKATYGFTFWGVKGGKWKWIDAQWVTFIQSYEGNWDSGPLCGEQFETRYRWAVSLLQDDAGNVTGTVHFHDCPGGGQAIYSVTGTVTPGQTVLTMDGNKVDGAGKLGENTPATQTFTVERNRAPDPNYAP